MVGAAGGGDPVAAFGIGATKVAYAPPADVVAAYETLMRDEAYNTVENLAATHYFREGGAARRAGAAAAGGAASAAGAGASSMKRHMRVSAEMANLPTLAVNYPSSILVRQDESSIDYLRALMTGPADTPYAGGCFFFDVYLPPSYPQVNPSVIFLTTGGGTARFNPNLYADGKVCLSLLGTWSGPGWDPAISTLSQVLVSIQAQIMNEAPYYNE
jgi:ubiquitin-protein ligase